MALIQDHMIQQYPTMPTCLFWGYHDSLAMTRACPAHLRWFTPESKFHTWYRGTVVKATPGCHIKSVRVKTYTVSNQRQLQAILEAKYFWTMPIHYDPQCAVTFAQLNPSRWTMFILFPAEPSRDPQRFEKEDLLYRFVHEVVDDSTAMWLVPRYQVVVLDYKPVQWNWEEVKI